MTKIVYCANEKCEHNKNLTCIKGVVWINLKGQCCQFSKRKKEK